MTELGSDRDITLYRTRALLCRSGYAKAQREPGEIYPAQAQPIAVKLRMYIVDILSFAYGGINIIAVNAEHSDIPRWRGSGGGLA